MADRGVTRTLGALALSLLVAACSGEDGPTATELVDTSWTLVSIADPREVVEPVPGFAVTLGFDADEAGGQTGCNRYAGPWDVTDGALRVAVGGMTLEGCGDQVDSLASRFVRLLSAGGPWVADAQSLELTVDDDGTETVLRFAPQRDIPWPSIVDRTWLLVEAGDAGTPRAVPTDTTLIVDDIGVIEVASPCRNYSNQLVLDEDSVNLESAWTIVDGCPISTDPGQVHLDLVLRNWATIELRDGRLTIGTEYETLTFEPA